MSVLVLNIGCHKSTEPIASDVYVNFEIESAFQNDAIRLFVDSQLLVDSTVTTDYTISLAWSSGLRKLSRNNHTLHFEVVDYAVQKDSAIDVTNDTSTVLLRFDKSTREISIQQIKGNILRD